MAKAKTTHPTVFIGSSSEGLRIAKAIQVLLAPDYDVKVWYQGVFGLSQGTLEALVAALGRFDFAILIVTPDDLVVKRGRSRQAARDNVVFELGLFMGHLGRDRTFIVYDPHNKPDLPTDLAGITAATFRMQKDDDLPASLGAACTMLDEAMRARGLRSLTRSSGPLTLRSEHECQDAIRDFVEARDDAVSLHVMSAGLGSRLNFITNLHRQAKRGFFVEVLAQGIDDALDQADARRMASLKEILGRDHKAAPLEIRQFSSPATIRSLILCDSQRRPLFGTASWYIYQSVPGEPNRLRISGQSNPAIVLDAQQGAGALGLLTFLIDIFETTWKECRNKIYFPSQGRSRRAPKTPRTPRSRSPG